VISAQNYVRLMGMIITLIGYRGSGKSSLAGPLADQLGWCAIDADDEIEQRAGKTIAEIFADDGEPKFRELERQVMKNLLESDQLIIAAGGGAILNEKTRSQMKAAGPVVWLRASVDVLAARIGGDETTAARRPNLTSTGGREEIERVLAEREPLYRECASCTVDTGSWTVDEMIAKIVDAAGPLSEKDG
jgi:shikimate kinase